MITKEMIAVGDRVKFPEFNYFWKVRAIDNRYAVCTAYRHYTIIDFDENIRSTGTSWGLGHDTDKNIAESMLALNGMHPDGIEQELSNRNKVPLKIEQLK